jgi:hypothetical protein
MYGRGSHQLRVSGSQNIRDLIVLTYPYSVVKKRQLEVAWSLNKLIGKRGQRVTNQPQRTALRNRLMELNSGHRKIKNSA